MTLEANWPAVIAVRPPIAPVAPALAAKATVALVASLDVARDASFS